MKKDSSGSADVEADPKARLCSSPSSSNSSDTDIRSSLSRNRVAPGNNYWEDSNRHDGNPHASNDRAASPTKLETVFNSKSTTTQPRRTKRQSRSLWSPSILCLLVASLGIIIWLAILNSFISSEVDAKGCRMSYMRPSYIRFHDFDTEHTRFATKYSLYLYRENGLDDASSFNGVPVLFIPGNAGSYKQVRPIAAEAANHFHHQLQYEELATAAGVRPLDFFTVDFNEDITAFHGQTLLDQAEYLNEAVRYILALYSDPQRSPRESYLPDPTSVIILGHSMGGIVARAMLVQPNYQTNSINTIITMSAPHARPPVTFDGQIVHIYDEINDYWREAYSQKWANNNPLWHVTLVSIAGGNLDTIVPSDYASLESLVPETHGFTVFTTGIPNVWTSMDHQAILWCDQFRKVVARALFDLVDVHRASQTKPRADRIRILKKWFLTGLESTSEKPSAPESADIHLTLESRLTSFVLPGERLVLTTLGSDVEENTHLLRIPHRGSSGHERFTLLTDEVLDTAGQNGSLEVLLCTSLTGQAAPSSSENLESDEAEKAMKLACRNAASDVILLPQSTLSSKYPFHLDRDREAQPFSHLQYRLEHLSDYQFVAIVDKATSTSHKFVLADFSSSAHFHQSHDITLGELVTKGLSVTLSASRSLATEIRVPSIESSLLVYTLELEAPGCNEKQALFGPMIRQYLERPYESRYFVNVKLAHVSLHGVAPYLPPALQSRTGQGLTFDVWADPSCETALQLKLKVDPMASLGKLYMRYRTVFAVFPLLIVTLVLRKQFRVYDATGTFISFTESLEQSLRRSIPLLILSLTMLSLSSGGAKMSEGTLGYRKHAHDLAPINFHRNDLLIGTDDPFFWFLIPLIGVVCTGVCVILHYVVLAFTSLLGLGFGIMHLFRPARETKRTRSPSFVSPAFILSTPRRRMITTCALLLLVSTFIPYQFAYLVACLVQLFTVIRALRLSKAFGTSAASNYYHYTHSVLLLMLWVLPINLPILAVWIRNLAVHWLTPFSSHHNVLSIMPFILLVENLTAGKMIPQLKNSMRHVTSVLLFGTALAAAIYGVSHAYVLHHLVNLIAAWLVIIHSTTDSWSLTGLGAIFDGYAGEARKQGKRP